MDPTLPKGGHLPALKYGESPLLAAGGLWTERHCGQPQAINRLCYRPGETRANDRSLPSGGPRYSNDLTRRAIRPRA